MKSMDHTVIANYILRQLDSKAASTFFVNGAPGTGKSFLLYKLSEELPKKLRHLKVLGPFKVNQPDSLGMQILNELAELCYLENVPGPEITNDLNSTWHWLKDRWQPNARQAFVILIDMEGVEWDNYDELRVFLSSMRYLEHLWDTGPARLAILAAGFWDHPGLEIYYAEELKLSFPYTVSQNYIVWEGLPLNSSQELLGNVSLAGPIQVIYGKLLHEIAGGNPKIMHDILDKLRPGIPSVDSLLTAVREAASSGNVGQAMLKIWKKLPPTSMKAIEELLLLRQVPVKSLSPNLERLWVAGILSERMILNQRYVTLRCWYTELLLRLHSSELGIENPTSRNPDIMELMPTISILHEEAYLLIHEIENLLRNFLATHLAAECSIGEPLLRGRGFKDVTFRKNGDLIKQEQDAQERAEQWQMRSKDNGLPVHLNPTMAYLSLGDLVGILNELAEFMNSTSWLRVAAAAERIVSIRDAVMHNQIIEIADLEKIYNLQTEIVSALSETSISFSKIN
jgi:hypothetical protein